MRAKPWYLVASGLCAIGVVAWVSGANSAWDYFAGLVCLGGAICGYREWRKSLKGESDG